VQREARALDGSAGAEGGAAEGKVGGGIEGDGALSRSLFDAAGNDDMLFEFLQHMAVGCRRACPPHAPAAPVRALARARSWRCTVRAWVTQLMAGPGVAARRCVARVVRCLLRSEIDLHLGLRKLIGSAALQARTVEALPPIPPPPPLALALALLPAVLADTGRAGVRRVPHSSVLYNTHCVGWTQVCEACVLAYTECTFTTALHADGPRGWASAFSGWLAQQRQAHGPVRTPGGHGAGARTPLADGQRSMQRRDGLHAAISIDQLRSVEINSLQATRAPRTRPLGSPRTYQGGRVWGSRAPFRAVLFCSVRQLGLRQSLEAMLGVFVDESSSAWRGAVKRRVAELVAAVVCCSTDRCCATSTL
jgi:hypothetical protein